MKKKIKKEKAKIFNSKPTVTQSQQIQATTSGLTREQKLALSTPAKNKSQQVVDIN